MRFIPQSLVQRSIVFGFNISKSVYSGLSINPKLASEILNIIFRLRVKHCSNTSRFSGLQKEQSIEGIKVSN